MSSIDVRYDDDPATTFTEPWPGDEVVVLRHRGPGDTSGSFGFSEAVLNFATESSSGWADNLRVFERRGGHGALPVLRGITSHL